MPSSCAMKGCKNYDKKVNKKEHGITYHRFPMEPTRKEIWSRIVRKQRQDPYFSPCTNTRICSAHFYENDFFTSKNGLRKLKDTAVPRYQIEIEFQLPPRYTLFCQVHSRRQSTDRLYDLITMAIREKSVTPDLSVPATAATILTPTLTQAPNPKSEDPLFVDLSDLNPIFDSPMVAHLKKRIEKLEKFKRMQSLKIKSLQKQNSRLIAKNKSLLDTNKALKQERIIMLDMESATERKVEKTEPNESNSSEHNILNPPTL